MAVLIYWFANLPGWFRLDVVKTSCYHHKTVARPPREARKPPSLGVVTDKRDDAVRTEPQVCCCLLVLVCKPHVCALLNREKSKELLGQSLAGWAKEGDWDRRTAGDENGKKGMEKSLWGRVETHTALRWVLGWTVGVKNTGIFPSPQL